MALAESTRILPGELEGIAAAYEGASAGIGRRVVVCGGTGCIANGSLKVFGALKAALGAAGRKVVVDLDIHDCSGADAHLSTSGCQGFCQVGPLVTIEPDGILYTHVKEADVPEIVERTFGRGELVEQLLYRDPVSGEVKRGKQDRKSVV